MRSVATALLLTIALMAPAPSIAEVKIVRKRSKVYHRARRDLTGIAIPNDNTSKIQRRSESVATKGETFAPKPPTPSSTAPSKAPIVSPTASPTASPTKYMVKVPISMKLVINGICECSPGVTEYLTSYVVDAFEGRFLGVSLKAKSSDTECNGSCAEERSRTRTLTEQIHGNGNENENETKNNQLRFLAEGDKLELSIEGYQVVPPGEENKLIDSKIANTAMNNALASQINWLANDSGLPITSGSIAVTVELLLTASPSLSPSLSPPQTSIDKSSTTETKSSKDTTTTVVISVASVLVAGILLTGYASAWFDKNRRRSAESPRADGSNSNGIVQGNNEDDYLEVNSDTAIEERADPVAYAPAHEDIETPAENSGDEVDSGQEDSGKEGSGSSSDVSVLNYDLADGDHVLKDKMKLAEEEDVLPLENVSPDENVPPADDEISNVSAELEGKEEEEIDENKAVSSQVIEVDESTEVVLASAVPDELDDMLKEEDEMVSRNNSSSIFPSRII